jgi:hypothetical protein
MLLFSTACSDQDDPMPVAEAFLEALQSGDYDKAGEYGTPETRKLLLQFQRIRQMSGDTLENKDEGPITILSEDLRNDEAVVYFRSGAEPGEQQITLRKVEVDGSKVWRVDLQKQELPWDAPAGTQLPS